MQETASQISYWDRVAKQKHFSHPLRLDWLTRYSNQHIPDSNEQRILLAEAGRVLRPGGLLYISDVLINNDRRNRERYERDADKYKCYGVFKLPEGVVVRHHRKEWIAEITSPFQELEYEPFTVTTMNGNASSAFQYLGRKSLNCGS